MAVCSRTVPTASMIHLRELRPDNSNIWSTNIENFHVASISSYLKCLLSSILLLFICPVNCTSAIRSEQWELHLEILLELPVDRSRVVRPVSASGLSESTPAM